MAKTTVSQSQEKEQKLENQQLQNLPQKSQQLQNQPQQNQTIEQQVKRRAFKIGIIVNGYNYRDLKFYNEQFRLINKLYKDKINLVFIGYRPEEDSIGALDGVSYEYVKPVSIIHYYKELKELKIDLMFIPLVNDEFNATSESLKKYIESGMYSIPVIVTDIYPYNKTIIDRVNGFIYKDRESFIGYLKDLLANNIKLIKHCGINCNKDVMENFNFNEENANIFSSVFDINY